MKVVTNSLDKGTKYYIYNNSQYLWQDGKLHNSCNWENNCGYWLTKENAEIFLINYKEKQMQERLEQVKKDISLLQVEQAKIEKKIEDEKVIPLRTGDVVYYKWDWKRIILYNKDTGKLNAYNENGSWMASENDRVWRSYKKIGRIKDFIK